MHKLLNVCLTVGLLGGAVAAAQADPMPAAAPTTKTQVASAKSGVKPCDPLIAGCRKAPANGKARGIRIKVAMKSGKLVNQANKHQWGGDNSIYPEG